MNNLRNILNQLSNRKSFQVLFSITLLFSYCNFLQAQDLHFAQYINSPLLNNPANTGFSPECDFRVGLNHRNQWAGTNVPYKTSSVWGDAQLFRNKIENGWIGLGATMLTDKAGTGNLQSTKLYMNVAYHQLLDDNNLLSFGLGAGFVQKRVDYTKLTFDGQWNGNFFDINIPNNEPFISNNVTYLDINVGINYAWFASDDFYINGGVSLLHINRPAETFFDPSTTEANISRRLNLFVNASIKVSDVLILNPHIYYSKINTSSETVIGIDGQYNLSGSGGVQQLLFGAYYRAKDAIIPVIGYKLNDIQIMFNYDVTTSSLSSYSAFRSAYEVSLVWKGIYNFMSRNERSVQCSAPKF